MPPQSGVILARADSRETLDEVLALNPFNIHEVVQYQVIQFTPSLTHSPKRSQSCSTR
ncbi:hypothetical protein DFAR_1540059 [Desulfarculales bacterium]